MTEILRANFHSTWRTASDAASRLAGQSRTGFGDWAAGARARILEDEPAASLQALNTTVVVAGLEDIVAARHAGRLLAQAMKFPTSRTTLVTTAISELARNILLYAGFGEIALAQVRRHALPGIRVTAMDDGPGIENVPRVLAGGYSTSGGLGLGLCGLQRIVDDFRLESRPGQGTSISATVWSNSSTSS
jgi:serine/threonine-protein kinase RsbT